MLQFSQWQFFLAYTGFTREAEGSGNSLLLNLTEIYCILTLVPLYFRAGSMKVVLLVFKSEEKTQSFLGIAIALKRSPYQTSALAVHNEQ